MPSVTRRLIERDDMANMKMESNIKGVLVRVGLLSVTIFFMILVMGPG